MKKLMFATALGVSAAAFAAGQAEPSALNATSFEGYTAGQPYLSDKGDIGENGGSKYFCYTDGDSDGSSVKAFGVGDNLAAPSITRPFYYGTATPNDNYLELSTEGGILWRSINEIEGSANAYTLGDAVNIAADGIYLDTLVQFTPTEDGAGPTDLDEDVDKLAIWLNVDQTTGATNLMARAGFIDSQWVPVASNFVLTGASVVAGEWHRLTIKAVDDVTDPEGYGEWYKVPAFIILIDGVEMAATVAPIDASVTNLEGTIAGDFKTLVAARKVFPSMVQGTAGVAATLQGVGFKGSGALDDIVWTEDNPFPPPDPTAFTFTWPAGLTAVSYTLGDGEPVSITGNSPLQITGVADGTLVTFRVRNADGAQKEIPATASESVRGIDATNETFGWPEYLGAAVAGAYEIDDLAELILFQKGVAAGLETASTTFKLTDDVTLTAPWPGVGIQNGKDLANGTNEVNFVSKEQCVAEYDAGAFKGSFDGQNHTISEFQMQGGGLDYCGFFNSIKDATIQNLKIQYAGSLFAADTTGTSAESGATFAGVAKSSTLQNLTSLPKDASTSVSCSKGIGGIVGYHMAGTTVESCTNNVNLESIQWDTKKNQIKRNKAGGISMITQNGSGQAILRNCQNNGTTTGSNEHGGLVGYIGQDTTIDSCESTVADKLLHRQTKTVTLLGTNKGLASVLAYSNATNLPIDGLAFATVDGNVATFVKVADFAMGNTYRVTGTAAIETTPTYRPGAIATFNFTAAGTIAFDTSLAVPTWNVTADEGLDLTYEDVNNVRTYTAAAQGGDDYVVEIDGSDVVITPQAGDLEALAEAGVDTNSVAAVNAALAQTIEGTSIPAWQALFLGVAPTEQGLEGFKIKSISFDENGKVKVVMDDDIALKTGRGVTINLKLMGSSNLKDWTLIETATDSKAFTAVQPGLGETKKFYKVEVEFTGSSN